MLNNYIILTNFRADKFLRLSELPYLSSSPRKLEMLALNYFSAPSTKLQKFGTEFQAQSENAQKFV